MDISVTITFEQEYAEELLSAVKSVLKRDNKENFLSTDDYNALNALEESLFMKVGG